MQTALDADPSTFNAYERRLVDAVTTHGWFSVSVGGEDARSSFTYTIGFWRSFGQPEVIISGLSPSLSYDMLSNLHQRFEASPGQALSGPLDGLLANVPVLLAPASEEAKKECLLSANWFYGGDAYPCQQMIWPDVEGVFSWEPGVNVACVAPQDILVAAGWEPPKRL